MLLPPCYPALALFLSASLAPARRSSEYSYRDFNERQAVQTHGRNGVPGKTEDREDERRGENGTLFGDNKDIVFTNYGDGSNNQLSIRIIKSDTLGAPNPEQIKRRLFSIYFPALHLHPFCLHFVTFKF